MDITFKVVVVFTIIQRISELFLSKRNEAYLIKKGARVIPEKNYFFMVVLHSSWLACVLHAAFFIDLSLNPTEFYFWLVAFLFGQALRITAIKTLGKRWSTRIVILPEAPALNTGVFKFIRHPNYLGVVIEIIALPMMAGLYTISILFSVLNSIILYFRIKKEESLLKEFNNYNQVFNLNEK